MRSEVFTPDCSRCAGLCCLALAFDEGAAFGFGKPAGLACRHLGAQAACSIHGRLEEAGFSGCATYTCLGAGQIVVQDVFGGRSWQDDPALTAPMIAAFATLREIQDLRAQLLAARALDLDPAQTAQVAAQSAALAPADGWTEAALAAFDLSAARAAFRALVQALRQDIGTVPGGGHDRNR